MALRRVTFKLMQFGGDYIIQLNFNHDQGRFRKSLGIKCKKEDWSLEGMRVKNTHPQNFEVNKLLDMYSKKIMDTYYKAVNDSQPLTVQMINDCLASGHVKRRLVDLGEFFEQFIQEREYKGTYHQYTIKHYRNCFRKLFHFSPGASFDDITFDFLTRFDEYLIRTHKLADNSRGKMHTIMFAVLNQAQRKGIFVKPGYKEFKKKSTVSHHVYLNLTELKQINEFDYHNLRLRNAVDIFMIAAFTGMRYSDFSRFKLENIKKVRGVEMIYFNQSKTGNDVVIPLHRVVKEVISRNSGLPKMISSQKLNDYLKEACRAAGIDQKIVHYYNSAGRQVSEVVEKWELITSHTGRRSCATNMHIAGVDHKLIMKLTGHTKESTFMRYLCIEKEDSAMLLFQSGFFS